MIGGAVQGPRLGVDVGGTTITALVTGSDGRMLALEHGRVEPQRSVPGILDNALTLAARALSRAGSGFRELSVAGFALPGEVDAEHGIFRASPILPKWRNVPVTDLLQQKIGRPVAIENDANAALLGERFVGAARDVESALLITIGTGVGGALLCRGEVISGCHGSAGEIGHVSVETGGEHCWCGGVGCLGLYASTTALLNDYSALSGSVCRDGHEFTRRYLGSDSHAGAAVEHLGLFLARGIAAAVSLVAPEKIILAGGILDSLAVPVITATRKHLEARPYPTAIPRVKVVPAELGARAGALGASLLRTGRGGG